MARRPVITPQAENFPQWYQDILAKAELADNGPGRGTMRDNGARIRSALWGQDSAADDQPLTSALGFASCVDAVLVATGRGGFAPA
jgi:hypothetical protein